MSPSPIPVFYSPTFREVEFCKEGMILMEPMSVLKEYLMCWLACLLLALSFFCLQFIRSSWFCSWWTSHPLSGVDPEMRADVEFVSTRSFNWGSEYWISGPYLSRLDVSDVGYVCSYIGGDNVCLVLVSLTHTMPFWYKLNARCLSMANIWFQVYCLVDCEITY